MPFSKTQIVSLSYGFNKSIMIIFLVVFPQITYSYETHFAKSSLLDSIDTDKKIANFFFKYANNHDSMSSTQVNTLLDDLLKMLEDYPMDDNIEYNINMKALHDIHVPLLELNNMIGMADMKNNIVDQIIYFIQDSQDSN